ncbi:MAG: acyltransferase [Frankiales bacterium]|nr:MAG: acyltransferase [Frankiales bacterium]
MEAVPRTRLAYSAPLDGLRGLAVAAVLLFHAEVPGVRGGHLGVTAFFTLSGFLITALLLVERQATGRIDLRVFWVRRARRLVPAVLVCLPLVALVLALSPTPATDDVTWDAVAAAFWFANWRFIADEQTYADLFALPSPFQHFWSLAVEEQFYLVYPLLVVALLGSAAVLRRRRLALVLGALTVLSTVQLFRLAEAGGALGRAYYGTDARVAELLVGALLAVALLGPSGLRTPGSWAGPVGLLGMAGLMSAIALLDKGNALLSAGGYLAVAMCTAAVIASALRPETLVARLLSVPALVVLGIVSYGVYLFHWPLFLLLTESFTGSDPITLFLVRIGATLGLAWASYELIEWPVRHGAVRGWRGVSGWAGGAVAGLTAIAVAAGQLPLSLPGPTAPLSEFAAPPLAAAPSLAPASPGASASASRGPVPTTGPGAVRQQAVPPGQQPAPVAQPARSRPRSKEVPKELTADPANSEVPPPPDVPPGALRVVVVGDSIGNNLGQGLRAWAEGRSDVAVYNLALPACPISRGGERRLGPDQPFPVDAACGWWNEPGHERRQALEQFDPDVIVLQDGVNEVFDRRLPEWEQWRRPGDPQFDSWLIEEYQAAFAQWDATMLVTNAPCGDWGRYEHFDDVEDPEVRVSALNVDYRRLPGVELADLFQRICPGGRYSDEVEGVENGRPDGFHLSAEASAALARNWLGPLVLEAGAKDAGPL